MIMAVHVTGLQRWSAAVGSFKALALVHAITSLAETHARRQGGTLEHVQGDTLLLSWPTRQPEHHAATEHEAVQSAVQAGAAVPGRSRLAGDSEDSVVCQVPIAASSSSMVTSN